MFPVQGEAGRGSRTTQAQKVFFEKCKVDFFFWQRKSFKVFIILYRQLQ